MSIKAAVFVVFLTLEFLVSCGAEVFTFVVICDGRGKLHTKKCSDEDFGTSPVLKPLVSSILEKSRERKIDLLLFPGDLIAAYFKRDASCVHECNRQQLARWKEIFAPISQAGIPIRITAGNHEAMAVSEPRPAKCGSYQYPYTPSLENFEVLKESLPEMIQGELGPSGDLGFTYSFDQGPCHFTMLNAYTMTRSNSFSEETIQWLIQDLDVARKAGKLIFVASHPPAFPGSKDMWDSLPSYDPTYSCDGYDPRFGIDKRRERDRFWNILKERNVVAYFCGHEHNIQIQLVEGVWHILSGGLTEKLQPLNGSPGDKEPNTILYDGAYQNPRATLRWPWDENKKSYWGWLLITVDGDNIILDVFGSDILPTKSSDFRKLKTFLLKSDPKRAQ